MEKVRAFIKESDWEKVGIIAFYGYFAVNILMKAFCYDHGDQVYKVFFAFGMSFLAIKIFTTKYTLREVIWVAILVGLGLGLAIITKQNTWLLLFATIVGIKNCKFEILIKIAVYIRTFSLFVLTAGSFIGFFDIGQKMIPDANYVEIPVYDFAMKEPNTAFLAVFLALTLLLYYNYEKLNIWWFIGTSIVAVVFFEFTYCRTGIAVFFFCWVLIVFEKCVKNKRIKFVLALSVPIGALFSLFMMVFFNAGNSVMSLINRMVTSRVSIMNGYYLDQGISLFPRVQEYFYASYHGLIDNTYMFVLIYCGAIIALFFFGLVSYTLIKLYKMGCYKELIIIACMALYGILEQFIMNAFMNPFILLCGILLYPDFLDEREVAEK